MTIEELQNNYIIDPQGDWRKTLTEEEKQLVRKMDNGRIGELLKELQYIINMRKKVKDYGKC